MDTIAHRHLGGGLLAWALLAPAPALACGGFFCEAAQPVDQTGETILFAVDDEAEEVEVHVQIQYEGPSEDFGWILPVPTEPEPFLSTADVLDRIATATNPTFVPTFRTEGTCRGQGRGGIFAQDMSIADGAGGSTPPTDANGVTVTFDRQVGPYETQVFTAEDAAVLLEWLDDRGYDLPDGATERIRPYVDEGSWFVGLQLAKDSDTGDLQPFAMRYPGSDPVIPLQLTGVAAADDMPLQPLVLAKARAVPDNYLHVHPNLFAVDWLNSGSNYFDVITGAANAAGGQAFATDFAGPTSDLAVHFAGSDQFDITLDALDQATDALDVAVHLLDPRNWAFDPTWTEQSQIPVTEGTLPILADHVDKPARFSDVEDLDYYSCLGCFVDDDEIAVDGAALAADLQLRWVEPMRSAQRLWESMPYLSRMTSSISADEMTLDPRFVVNPDLGDVAAARQAEVVTECSRSVDVADAPRRLELPDGRTMPLPSTSFTQRDDYAWERWAAEVLDLPVETIEQTGRAGAPVLMSDHGPEIADAIDQMSDRLGVASGCACATAGPEGRRRTQGGLAMALLALVGLLRRRDPAA